MQVEWYPAVKSRAGFTTWVSLAWCLMVWAYPFRATLLMHFSFIAGRIRTIQLNYTEAHGHLQQAIRRAPPPQVAPGFWQATHKLFVVVELLMGDLPDRALFRGPVLKSCLQPYFEIVQGKRLVQRLSLKAAVSRANTFDAL